MAYFTKLGVGNIVEQVIVVNDSVSPTEQAGVEFLRNLYNDVNSQWFQTYEDGSLRKNHAGIGFKYDQTRDAFIEPKPFASWTLNETTCRWEAPVVMPTTELEDNKYYFWNESILNWEIKTK